MALRHDSQGFLAGDVIDIGRALSVWSDIRADVRAIRQAMAGQRPASGPSADRPVRPVATPGPRDNLGRFVRRDSPGPAPDRQKAVIRPAGRTRTASSSESTQPTASRTHSPAAPVAQAVPVTQAAPVTRTGAGGARPESPSGRDERGRFSGGGGSGGSGAEPSPAGDGVLRGLFERLTGAASATGGALENADPAVKAVQEVAQPLARGYGMLTGNRSEKRKEGWFRRIYGSLAGFRKDESVFNKASNKSLKTLEDRPAASGNVNVGMMAGIMPMLAMLFRGILLPIAGAIAAWNVGQWIGEKLYAWMDKAGINTIIFDAFDGAKKWIEDGWNSVTGLFKSAYEGLKSIPVIGDAIRAAEKLTAKALEVVAPAVAVVKQGATDAAAGAKQAYTGQSQAGAGRGSINPGLDTRSTAFKAGELAGGAAKSAVGASKAAGNWVLGQTSKLFESGGGGAGTVSSGKGDHGGASYGTYQMSSSQGTVQNFLKSSKYGAQFEGLTPGTPEFKAKWKEVANADPEFGSSQHDYIKKTHFDPAAAGLAKAGIDLSGRGAAVQDALWSTSVQFGAGSSKKGNGAIGLFQKALAGKDASKLSDADITAAVQDYKIANNEQLFASSSAKNRAGTARRAVDEKQSLGVLAMASSAPAAPTQTAFAAAPKAPTFAAPAPIADAPPVINPLGTGADSKRQISVTLPAQDVGQDVKDRRIAHIQTGGLSGG